MKFDLIRGSNDSAPIEEFEFFVYVDKLTPFELQLRFEFSRPLSISIGSYSEVMRISVINPNLFISKKTGKTLVGGVIDGSTIPRQFKNQDEFNLMEQSNGALEVTYQSCGSLTLFATFLLGVSLKPLWNFKNAMQIIAYLRHLAYMPANVDSMLTSLNDAVTFKPVKDYIFEEHLIPTNEPIGKLH